MKLYCTECGVQGKAECSCGVAYKHITAGEAAILAIAAHPNWSNRRIATAVGVSLGTINAARSTERNRSVENSSAETNTSRVGADGRQRRVSRTDRPRVARRRERSPDSNETITRETRAKWSQVVSACSSAAIKFRRESKKFTQFELNDMRRNRLEVLCSTLEEGLSNIRRALSPRGHLRVVGED